MPEKSLFQLKNHENRQNRPEQPVIPAQAGIQLFKLLELGVGPVQLSALARVLQAPRHINPRLLNHRVWLVSRHGDRFIPLIGHLQRRLNRGIVRRGRLADSGALGGWRRVCRCGGFEFDHALL
jgi:hypothetical protein